MKSTSIILGMFAFGYFMAILFRSVNALIAPNLVTDIGLDAAMLGLLTSALLFAHAGLQLPLGMALDRFGPRRVQSVLLCSAAVGSLLFSIGQDVYTLALARALIGAGFAGALMSGFKAVTLSLPAERHALGNAIVMGGGQIGYIVATWPAEIMVSLVGWRLVFIGLAAVTVIVAILYFILVPDFKSTRSPQKMRDQFSVLRQIFTDPVTLRIAPLVWTTAGFNIAILTLWAGPWFRDVAGFDRAGVATALLLNACAAVTGIFIGGWIADRLGRRGIGLLDVMYSLLLIFFIAQIPIIFGWTLITPVVWLLFAAGGQWGMLCYPWLAAYFGKDLSSRAQTGVNMGIFVFAFLAQYLFGEIINLFKPSVNGGYSPDAYQVCFAIAFVCEIAALIWFISGRKMLNARYRAKTLV